MVPVSRFVISIAYFVKVSPLAPPWQLSHDSPPAIDHSTRWTVHNTEYSRIKTFFQNGTFSPVGSAFDLKIFRSKFDPAREPTLFSLFFFSLELFSVNLYLFLLFHLRNVRKTRKKKDSQRLQLRRNVWGLVQNVNFPRENTIILNANCFSVSLNIHRTLDRLFKSEILQWKENKRDFMLFAQRL